MKKLFSILILMGLIAGCVPKPVVQGIANQVASVRSTVVHIEKVGKCQGSGCIISPDGIIFTAKHVTDGGGKFIVTLDDGTKYETDVAVECKDYDAAFLKINPTKPLKYALLARVTDLRVGDPIFIMGSPFGSDNINSVSLGIISAMQRNLDADVNYGFGWRVTFQTDATAEPGNSGGPVFNLKGEVVGVLVAGMDATVNYSVPVAVFMYNLDVVKQLFRLNQFEIKNYNPPMYICEVEN
jgi:S1-C subfamily serine protease